ncbi:flavodoxin domain-containing protein [Streptomyces durbertensis]|uniref:Flavodoxin domain-containing protein n=1 Tax=Streptomyces durbertensis TaxID=2448886 RepID=A0ABR6EAI7_9ACTN|nr:flavodoxin domain-containing protein [Streptomyces durbertensis]MBB1242351.1 flavodoxin domain-containing protein [Streptomyces durbertensis]
MTTRVLVAYGSRHGSTAGIAEQIGATLRADGCEADVVPAGKAEDVADYDAVVLGGALYAGRWHGDARRFARRHGGELADRPVFLFSSGPIDDSATRGEVPPAPGVKRLAARLGAREHVTFGGSVTTETPGWFARQLVRRGHGGDFRDPERVRSWAHHVAADLEETESD